MSENQEDVSLLCSVKLCHLDKSGNVTRQIASPKSFLQIGRNEFRDIILKLECGKISSSYSIKDLKLHTKFFKEGKATISLKEPSLQIFISNCPTGKLGLFLKTLMAKVENLKTSTPVTVKERLQSLKPTSFQEISPLTATDIKTLNNKVNKSSVKQSTWPQTPKTTKRKRVENKEDITPTRVFSESL